MKSMYAIDTMCEEFDSEFKSRSVRDRVLIRGQCCKWIKAIQAAFDSTDIYDMWHQADDYCMMHNDINKEV